MILVTGGTGFVGSKLVRRLVEEGEQTRCLVRDPSKAGKLQEQGIEPVVGDVTELESLRKAMGGVETVVHLVAIIREKGQETFERVNVKGTKNVVAAAQELGVKRFIHMSVLGADSNPKYRYTYSKWRAEEEARNSFMQWVIFRPAIMFGHGNGFVGRLIKSLTIFPFIAPIPGSGKVRFQPIWVEDVVSCVLQVMQNWKTGQTYELGGPDYLTYEEMLDILMEALGLRKVKIKAPITLMRPVAPLLEKVLRDPPVTSTELAQLDSDNITEIDKVERGFGFKPLGFRQWVRESIVSQARKT